MASIGPAREITEVPEPIILPKYRPAHAPLPSMPVEAPAKQEPVPVRAPRKV